MVRRDPEKTITRESHRKRPKAPVRARLSIVFPRPLAAVIELGTEPVVIGRQPGEEGETVSHETVSRRHARIAWDPATSAHVVTELGSHNGSRRMGCGLVADTPVPLADGDVLQFGDVLGVYESTPVPECVLPVSVEHVPGESGAIARLRAGIARAAPDPSPVLLIGETGTGKEWIAGEIHRLSGRTGPLVTVNCAALTPQLAESQLFGHVRGAFTGASTDQEGLFRAADGGSLLLDEVGELSAETQAKLLRVLQERSVLPVGATRETPVDVRVIAATNRDLTAAVESGEFRRDLYARLALWELRVPPLRERRADILDWAQRLYSRWLAQRPERQRGVLRYEPDAAELLLLSAWPENLRGLDRLIHQLATVATEEAAVGIDKLPAWLGRHEQERSTGPAEEPPAPGAKPEPARKKPPVPTAREFTEMVKQLEGNVRALARHYGRDRRQIYRWLDAYGLRDACRDDG